MATPEKNTDAVYDASTLGTPKMLVLGLQHLFAMFGATVLVPAITGPRLRPPCSAAPIWWKPEKIGS